MKELFILGGCERTSTEEAVPLEMRRHNKTNAAETITKLLLCHHKAAILKRKKCQHSYMKE